MALNWDVREVKNYKKVVYKKVKSDNGEDEIFEINKYPNRIIWSTMGIGMSEITQDNYIQFYNRLKLFEDAFGCYYKTVRQKRVKDFTPLKEIQKMIGLKVNVSPLSTNKFLKMFKEFY